jgi:hypothetical protein
MVAATVVSADEAIAARGSLSNHQINPPNKGIPNSKSHNQDNRRSKVTVSALLLGAISCVVLGAALPLGAVAVSALVLGSFGCVVLLEAVTLDAVVVVAIAC